MLRHREVSTQNILVRQSRSSENRFWHSTAFWGVFATSLALGLFAVAIGLTGETAVSGWSFVAAWPFLLLGSWWPASSLRVGIVRIMSFMALASLCTFGLVLGDSWLEKRNELTSTAYIIHSVHLMMPPPPSDWAVVKRRGLVHAEQPIPRDTSHPTSTQALDWLSSLTHPPTMRDLFAQDFANTLRLSNEDSSIHWRDTGHITVIKTQLYLDFPAFNKFVGFYVPSTDPTDPSRTVEACLKLLQANAVQQALDDMPKKTPVLALLG